MALKNTNPTKTRAWQKLTSHFSDIKEIHLKEFFKNNANRISDFSFSFDNFTVDYSKNRINQETLELLIELANEVDLKEAIEKYFSGDIINTTENRAVLHTALRDNSSKEILVEKVNVKPEIKATLNQIAEFSEKVIYGKWKGFTGKSITNVVNIGIGGSDLGPNMIVEALQFYKNHLNLHFVSNVDGDHISEIIKKLHPETTLFVIVSKTFTTQETITNATTLKEWFLKSATKKDIAKHFVAVSSNIKEVVEFGISNKNIFPMWNWVGGRFSLWSAVGLSISLSVGFQNFKALLDGASEMDAHFKNTEFEQNIPVISSLISIWYNNFFGCETEAILPYSHYLKKLPEYLQQTSMESNGKSVDRNGKKIDYQTGAIIWGDVGTNMQHAFMQLLHQGTKLIPAEFIGFKESLSDLTAHHKKLMANFCAQTEALAFGKTAEEVHLDLKFNNQSKELSTLLPFKVFGGNKPSTTILIKKLTPNSLGKLIALYEHKVFVQGVVWNIFSFDQFGVELGKELVSKHLNKK
ncbi:Glucose-6-phosphate isomerase [Polaribacter huanghezhanensis]|uniref:glucose-6-phosphate isomerase n=1 Tax=Polaribacter huanghezhanensis TaxID=1354726 RepID=UPI002646FD70|nr:glucose-6-phosphate isomerase [Polaribacter huanghezhanensis]WKD85172.1 Glucose-6-phosphate isomerase [Polaribacter huanghezhanensis]